MFGPNTHLSTTSKIEYSHRDTEFTTLHRSLTNTFINKFNLSDYDVLFIPGSGTIGIESVFWSLKKRINVIGYDGIFTKRWEKLSELYSPYNRSNYNNKPVSLYCQLETSVNHRFEKEGCIVDAISSFPYYDIPKDTKIFVTCSNKQLGALPGLSIVCVRKDYWSELEKDDVFSYLNLARYKKYSFKNQTPSTPPLNVYKNLYDTLLNFNIDELRNKIERNSNLFVDNVQIHGEQISPVLNILKTDISKDIATKYELYGLHSNSKFYQIFTYSCDDIYYKKLSKEL